jgi:predicted RNA-binding Zn-ribbon protein involved in translation (DUF1610 family)
MLFGIEHEQISKIDGYPKMGYFPKTMSSLETNSGESKLVKCPDCSHEVSRHATTCPQCGYPLNSERCHSCQKNVVPIVVSSQKPVGAWTVDTDGPVSPTLITSASQTKRLCPHCGATFLRSPTSSASPVRRSRADSGGEGTMFVAIIGTVVLFLFMMAKGCG